jgi:tetratricopeptide (TPR) repeat protein
MPDKSRQIEELYKLVRERGIEVLGDVDPVLRQQIEQLQAQDTSRKIFGDGVPGPIDDSTVTVTAIRPQLGPYKIEQKLGEGGMGEVYRAVDTRLGRTVAVKLVRREMAGRVDFRERFAREARAIAALSHPHICTLYDIGEQDGVAYLVMEYVEGETLAARLREGPLALDLVLHYGEQAASALAAAHARGIIHRDLKPANLMLTPFGIKVLDFGLAKFAATAAGDPPQVSGVHAVMGTPGYMSPEQCRGEPLDGRSDTFALGCVLYQAATGIAPFRGQSVLAVLNEVATATPPPPNSVRPQLPKELDAILERALAKDREQRYASASDFEQALAELQTSGGTVVASESEPQPLIGREPEMGRLQTLFEEAVSGKGGLVLLVGELGMGKTALAESFLHSVAHRHPKILVGRGACVEQYGAGEAYLPFLDAMSGLLSGTARARVMAVLRRHAPTWCLQFPAVFPDSALEGLRLETIGANKERMLREFGDALAELTATSPLVLLLEDLHWADRLSVDLIRHLGQRVRRHRLLLLGTVRPEGMERDNLPLRNCKSELQGHGSCAEIVLRELSEGDVWHYLNQYFTSHNFPQEFARVIHRKTEGHPLFITGAMQFLTERGEVVSREGKWALTRPALEIDLQVPESVHNLIRKQIEVLGEEDRRTLQYASVEGEDFTSTVLAALLGVPELEVEERLAHTERVHRLIRTRGAEELPDGSQATRYRFAHALYQNILYQDLSNQRRIQLHRQTGEELRRCWGKETARIGAALATHFERGRDFSRTIEYLMQAADVALSRYASESAEEHCSRALLVAEKLPPEERTRIEAELFYKRGRGRQALRMALAVSDFEAMLERARSMGDSVQECTALTALAFAHRYIHRPGQIAASDNCARETLRIAERIDHQGFRALSYALLGGNRVSEGELEAAILFLDQSLDLAREAKHSQALLASTYFRGLTHFFQGEYEDAERLLLRAIEMASTLRDGFLFPFSQLVLGWVMGNQGRMSEALAIMAEALEQTRRNGNVGVLSRIPNSIAWIYRELQDFETATRLDREAAETAQAHGIAEGEANSHVNLIHDYTHSGEFENAAAAIRHTRVAYDHDPWMHWRFLGIRLPAAAADYWLARGDLAQASEHAETLLANATRAGARKYIATAHWLRAEIATTSGDEHTTEGELLAGVEVLRGHPAPLAAWRIYASLGRLYTRVGQSEAAQQAYRHAASLLTHIASQIKDDRLRSIFQDSIAVQEVRNAIR